MAAVNPPGTPAYTNGPFNADGTPFIDTVDGVPTLAPGFGTSNPPTFSPIVINPITVSDGAGQPSQNAILVELRVITQLLLLQLGSSAPDAEQMRADEAWNTSLSTGAL